MASHHVQVSIPPGAEDQARKFYCGVLGIGVEFLEKTV